MTLQIVQLRDNKETFFKLQLTVKYSFGHKDNNTITLNSMSQTNKYRNDVVKFLLLFIDSLIVTG